MDKVSNILKLPATEANVVEILNYLNTQTLTVLEHQTVFTHLMKLYYELSAYPIVVEEGTKYYELVTTPKDYPNLEALCELIFNSAIHLEKYDLAYQYIGHRKTLLPVSKQYLAALNLIEFKKQTHQNYKIDAEDLIKDTIPDDIRLGLLQELLILYLNQNEPNKAITIIPELKRLDPEQKYIPLYFKTLLHLENYEEALKEALRYRDHKLHDMSAFLTLLKVYIHHNDTHRLAILVGDFSEKIDKQDLEFRKESYELLIGYYDKIKNKFQLDIYAKKLKALSKEEKKIVKNKTLTDTFENAEVVVKDYQNLEVAKIIKPQDNIYHMDILIELFSYAHQISETKQYREFLRLFFIMVESHFKALDYIVFTKKDEMLYHYKKERLYDKALVAESYLDTVIGEILADGQERFGTPNSLNYQKNILTSKPYTEEVGYVYGFALYDEGVLLIHLKDSIDDPGTYFDLFKGLAAIIYGSIKDERNQLKLKNQMQFLRQIIESDLLSIRILGKHETNFNKEAQRLLNVDSHLPHELFLRNLAIHEVKYYEQSIARLFEKKGLMDVLTYVYLDKQIREKMISIKHLDEIYIISYFEDITNYHDERHKLIEEATVDFETSLQNLNALNNHFTQYIHDKCSFLLISFNDAILPIYGSDVALQFFKEFGQRTSKFFKEGVVYRYATNQLFVYIPYNDIRTVTKLMKDYIKYLNSQPSVVVSYEQFEPKIAIIRYPVVTEEKLPSKLFRYLELSLDYLKRKNPENHFIFYEHSIYENEVFEQQVINYLNEAIETNQLSLRFNQIIDLRRLVVWQYESELILENIDVDSKYLMTIAKKRNRLMALEHHHIKMVCEFLNTLEKETSKLVKITIPVSKETFMDVSFNPLVYGLFKTYRIPFEFIRFKVKGEQLRVSQHLNQMAELTKTGIGLDTTSVETALSYYFNAVHIDIKRLDDKWLDYIKHMQNLFQAHQMACVVRDIKTTQDMEILKEAGIYYVEGSVYKPITADRLFLKIKGSMQDET